MGMMSGKMGMGLAIGIGASMVLPVAARIVGGIAKPVLKESIKGGTYVWDKSKKMVGEAKESMQDVAAEARHEKQEAKASS